MKHVFLPGALVFPGGRTERQDGYAPSVDRLDPQVEDLLLRRARITPARARAIALAAIRETFEETGILVGVPQSAQKLRSGTGWRSFLSNGVVPALSQLRFHSRAIIPAGAPRRFDTRFFIAEASAIAGQVPVTDNELEAPSWVTFAEARLSGALITPTPLVLDSLERQLQGDQDTAGPQLLRWSPSGALRSEHL